MSSAWASRPQAGGRLRPGRALAAPGGLLRGAVPPLPRAPALPGPRRGATWRARAAARARASRVVARAEGAEAEAEEETVAGAEEAEVEAEEETVAPEAAAEEPEAEEAEAEAEAEPAYAELLAGARAGVEDGTFDAEGFLPAVEAELAELAEAGARAAAEAAEAAEELAKTKDSYLRMNADFENFRKRSGDEKDALTQRVKGNTLEELLPLMDNFELASQQLKIETEGEEKVHQSYQGLYKQMCDIFGKLGLEQVPGVGSPFDPMVHDAIMREETTEAADGTVLEQFRAGWAFGDQCLRPSMVKVAVNDSPVAAAGEGDDAEAAGEEAAETAAEGGEEAEVEAEEETVAEEA